MNLDCTHLQSMLMNNQSESPISLNHDLAQHVSGCVTCAAFVEAQEGVKSVLQRALARDEAASVALRVRIRHELRQPPTVWQQLHAQFKTFKQSRVMAIAAGLLLTALGSLTWTYRQPMNEADRFAALNHEAAATEHNARILKIGFDNHQHCALARDYSAEPHTPAQMAQAIGNEWIALVTLAKVNVPTDYRVMTAHRCELAEREFIHLIMSNQRTLVSLILTRKRDERFAAQPAMAQIAGMESHQMREQNSSVVGFETETFLGYVVSGLEAQEHQQLAALLAPAVKEFVAQRKG